MPENPFGRWQKYRAQVAAMSRADADSSRIDEVRAMLRAARLADKVIESLDLPIEDRRAIARLLMEPVE